MNICSVTSCEDKKPLKPHSDILISFFFFFSPGMTLFIACWGFSHTHAALCIKVCQAATRDFPEAADRSPRPTWSQLLSWEVPLQQRAGREGGCVSNSRPRQDFLSEVQFAWTHVLFPAGNVESTGGWAAAAVGRAGLEANWSQVSACRDFACDPPRSHSEAKWIV